MYCDSYCQGRSAEIDCASFSGDAKEKCIKSCLDCRSPNKKFCYCPSIFPPPTKKLRSGLLGARSLMNDGFQSFRDGESETVAPGGDSIVKEKETQEQTDVVFIVCITVAVVVILIGVVVFCVMRYNRRKRGAAGFKSSGTKDAPPTMQQPEMQQGGRRGSGPRPQSNENRGQRGGPAETEDTSDYS